MDITRKKQIIEILDYWKIVELLGQIDISGESRENRKKIKKIRDGEKISAGKIELFTDLISPSLNLESHLEQDNSVFADYPVIEDSFSFVLGSIERNRFVAYLDKYIEDKEEKPEAAYPKSSKFAWFSFKTDKDGIYINNSFQFSPLLWAAFEWEKSRAASRRGFFLDQEKYDDIILQFN